MLLLNESTEILTLVTNSLKTDLAHHNQFVVGLALTTVGNLCSADIGRDLASDIDKHLRSENPYNRKKAALAAIRIFRKVPELIEDFTERICSLLSDRAHGVKLSGLQLMIDVIDIDRSLAPSFSHMMPLLIRMLRSLLSMGFAPEYDVSGVTDPFLQVKILRLMRALEIDDKDKDQLNDTLAQVATNTETAKNAGNAILYECVNTIMSIEANSSLRVLAINILGRFLLNRDNNIRYVALHTLTKVVADDMQAVQRHRATIVECLKDPDVSIRQRAMDLIYVLVDETNIKQLAREMLNYLVVAAADQKSDLCSKIADVMDNFAPTKQWHVDTMVTLLTIAGNHVGDRIQSNLIGLVQGSEDLHVYAVHKLFSALCEDLSQSALVHVGVWCIGEFGENLRQPAPENSVPQKQTGEAISEKAIVDLLDKIARMHSSTEVTKSYILTACIKLTARFQDSAQVARLTSLIARFKNSGILELQLRSCEYSTLITGEWSSMRNELLERMPAIDASLRKQKNGRFNSMDMSGMEDDPEEQQAAGEPMGLPAVTSAAAAPATDLLDFMFDGGAPAPAPAPFGGADLGFGGAAPSAPAPAPAAASNLDLLSDIFAAPAPVPQMAPTMPLYGGPSPPVQQMQPDIFGGGGVPQQPVVQNNNFGMPPAQPNMDLMGMGLGAPTPMMAPASVQMPMMPPAPAPAPIVPRISAFNKDGLVIHFDLSKPSGPGSETKVTAIFDNQTSSPISNLHFQAAVPKFLKLKLSAPSSTNIAPNSSSKVEQVMDVSNSLHGQKGIAMKIKLGYVVNGQQKNELFTVSNFPNNF
jgi:AP-1 complex subunit gamma-1